MQAKRRSYYQPTGWVLPNSWDMIAALMIFALFALLAWGAKQMTMPFTLGEALPIHLELSYLPEYGGRTVLRMMVAMLISLIFTFVFGTWAAKSRIAERIIIPAIDILQSVPVLGFLAIMVVPLMWVFPNSLLGPELACIFAIFTAQAWNMALSFYQSLCLLPQNLKEAANMFQLSAWQRFWRIEVPFAMPGLLWNMMMSMSASWFMIVYSEAIEVATQKVLLPGIGSYIYTAIMQADMTGVAYAIVMMFLIILCYDQLIFRPLIKWSEKFKLENTSHEKPSQSWVVNVLQRTRLLHYVGLLVGRCTEYFVNLRWFSRAYFKSKSELTEAATRKIAMLWTSFLILILVITLWGLYYFVMNGLSVVEILRVVVLGSYTAIRVIVMIALCSLLWVPVGVWVGLRPRVAQKVQPIAQFFAAFPANLLFPFVVITILTFNLNVEVWITPLMILGTQWYILFNVIAGASALPRDLYQVADNFNVTGWLWWRRLILPGVFPYYITGAITAAGGAWNASIAAEVVSWGSTTLHATGLGAYIVQETGAGNFQGLALGITVMCLYVLAFNRLFWQPLYRLAARRFHLDYKG